MKGGIFHLLWQIVKEYNRLSTGKRGQRVVWMVPPTPNISKVNIQCALRAPFFSRCRPKNTELEKNCIEIHPGQKPQPNAFTTLAVHSHPHPPSIRTRIHLWYRP